jgi:hypothetical protein
VILVEEGMAIKILKKHFLLACCIVAVAAIDLAVSGSTQNARVLPDRQL